MLHLWVCFLVLGSLGGLDLSCLCLGFLPVFWWYLSTCSDWEYLFLVDLGSAGFAVFYLCFSGTWVHVAVEMNLPVFWLYLGTCYD